MYYSQGVPRILNEEERREKAKQVLAILKVHIGRLDGLSCLDVGCSSGVITNEMAKYFKSVVGIDIDKQAIEIAQKSFKKKNLKFSVIDSEKLPFNSRSFNVVILNQVYEFTENPKILVKEIYKVLDSGGICYVGARNKYALIEGQTGIPLIHFLPYIHAQRIAKLFGKNYYPADYMNFREIKRLFKDFKIEDITFDIIQNAQEYNFSSLKKFQFVARLFPKKIIGILHPLIPNYLLLCKKVI